MNIIFIGGGAVFRAVLTCWQKIIPEYKINRAIIIEPRNIVKGQDVPEWLYPNCRHMKLGLTKNNHVDVLNKVLKKYKKIDFIIDLSVFVNGKDILDWAIKNKIHYINTALEPWEDEEHWDGKLVNMLDCTIYMDEKMIADKKYPSNTASCVLQIGQNPGCISLYALHAIDLLSKKYGISKKMTHAEKARKLGIETMHISEIDTQQLKIKKKNNNFTNTWSSYGFIEEALEPVQIGFGTHEDLLPEGITSIILDNQLILHQRGMDTWCESFIPYEGKIQGMLIPHSENNTMSKYLQIGDDYQPSVYYVYDSSGVSKDSLEELRQRDYNPQTDFYVVTTKDVTEGKDYVGMLFLFEDDKPAFWCGSILSNEEAKKIGTYHNATTQQVAAGVYLAIDWIMKNPNKGVNFPENIYYRGILNKVLPILGEFYCGEVDFKPESNMFKDLMVKKN